MNRRWVIAIFAFSCCVGAIGFVAVRLFAKQPDCALEAKALAGWPGEQAWSWSFRWPKDIAAGDGISLTFRSRSSPLAAGKSPVIHAASAAMSAKEAQREFGTGYLIPTPDSLRQKGTAVVQLIDLAEAGVASVAPGQSLRVMAQLNSGGTRTRLTNEAILLPPGHFAGQSVSSGADWQGNELYLMTFFIRGDDSLVQYDVFLNRAQSLPGR